jgi:PPK2 family polyphosphate:nucleotide phosphotransferase
LRLVVQAVHIRFTIVPVIPLALSEAMKAAAANMRSTFPDAGKSLRMTVAAPQLPHASRYRVEPGEPISLAAIDTSDTGPYAAKEQAHEHLAACVERIAELQERLYAEEERALLVVLQGIDAAGKDSSVSHVFRGTNPQGCRVYSFKEPCGDEAAHDFLWRYHQHTPAAGMIHVFNRSHYEDVLVTRVKELVPEEIWRSRYDSINDFERMLAREGTCILKFLLHISKDAQLDRFQERLELEHKHYKFSANDVRERRFWDDYQRAYEDAVNATSTPWAPWYVIPADHKWYRNAVVAQTVAGMLEAMDPQWPEPDEDAKRFADEELEPQGSSDGSRRHPL